MFAPVRRWGRELPVVTALIYAPSSTWRWTWCAMLRPPRRLCTAVAGPCALQGPGHGSSAWPPGGGACACCLWPQGCARGCLMEATWRRLQMGAGQAGHRNPPHTSSRLLEGDLGRCLASTRRTCGDASKNGGGAGIRRGRGGGGVPQPVPPSWPPASSSLPAHPVANGTGHRSSRRERRARCAAMQPPPPHLDGV